MSKQLTNWINGHKSGCAFHTTDGKVCNCGAAAPPAGPPASEQHEYFPQVACQICGYGPHEPECPAYKPEVDGVLREQAQPVEGSEAGPAEEPKR